METAYWCMETGLLPHLTGMYCWKCVYMYCTCIDCNPYFLFPFLLSPDNDDDITDSDCFIFPTNELARRYGDLAERRERYPHYYM